MGFSLFETSGTFNPSDYGLKAGDVINVVCVGGGAAGDYASAGYDSAPAIVKGSAGGNSSFGSYVTALGGGPHGSTQGNAWGLPGILINSYPYSGPGAGGWIPGVNASAQPIKYHIMTSPPPATTGGVQALALWNSTDGSMSFVGGSIVTQFGGTSNYVSDTTYASTTSLKGNGFGVGAGPAQGSHNWRTGTPIIGCAGGNGAGYGAGGGGGLNKNQNEFNVPGGGNSGEVKRVTVVLPNTNSITVTVGNGGAANTYGAPGAPGCVCIFW